MSPFDGEQAIREASIRPGGYEMQSQHLEEQIQEISGKIDQVLELLTNGRTKKVLKAQNLVESIIKEEKVVSRKAIRERTGISNSELSRCLRALEDEGLIMRRVDTSDGRKTVCVYQESATELSEQDESVLTLVHTHPELSYRELEEYLGLDRKAFQSSYFKLLSQGLVAHDEALGRLYSVVTHQGMQKIQGVAC